jgi:hypothetical protein
MSPIKGIVTWNNILVDHQHNPWSSLRSTRWLPVGSMYLGSRLNISLSDPQTVHSKKFLIRTFYSPLFLPKHCVKIWRSPPRSFFSIFFILFPPPSKAAESSTSGLFMTTLIYLKSCPLKLLGWKSLHTMGSSTYYPYEPTKAGATIAMLLFGSSAFFHLWQMIKTRTWFFTAFLIGAFSED